MPMSLNPRENVISLVHNNSGSPEAVAGGAGTAGLAPGRIRTVIPALPPTVQGGNGFGADYPSMVSSPFFLS